jgi:hypothetical protein
VWKTDLLAALTDVMSDGVAQDLWILSISGGRIIVNETHGWKLHTVRYFSKTQLQSTSKLKFAREHLQVSRQEQPTGTATAHVVCQNFPD